MAEFDELLVQVKRLCEELDRRDGRYKLIQPYREGNCPLPAAVEQARLTQMYRYIMPLSDAPWGDLVVGAKADRLEVAGLRDTDNDEVAKLIWRDVWQANGMDAESKLAHDAALTNGRCYATVWPDPDGKPDVALDDITQMVVEFAPGSRSRRVAALRRWTENKHVYAALYRPEGLYKFRSKDETENSSTVVWERYSDEADLDFWPLPNPFDREIPVVEVAVNRRLKPGTFPFARGEFEHCLGLLDRVNLLTFLGLVVAIWMGFPLRGVIGEKMRREVLLDDDGNPLVDEDTGKKRTRILPPFSSRPDSVAQFENPEAKTFEFAAADRKNLSIFPELDQLAVITKTPRHYFPMEGGMSQIAADTIRANEGALHAAVTGHKASTGEGWEEVNRLGGKLLNVELSPHAEIVWHDHEARSLGERADAWSKLKDLPWQARAELTLNASEEQIARWASEEAGSPMALLARAALEPSPSLNGA